MARFQKATIKDVAKRAGVSVTTVSLFVSGRSGVCSDATADRLRRVIEELNYTPSSLVSSVQNRATRTFGVCMSSPLDPDIKFGFHFYERLWRGIVAEADRIDYSLLHFPASARRSANADPFLDGRIDGLLYHTNTDADPNERPARLASAGLPIVLLTRSRHIPVGCGAVYTDERSTVTLAMDHLWDFGHRRIAHIAGSMTEEQRKGEAEQGADIALARMESYRTYLEARNAYDPALVGINGSWRDVRVSELVTGWSRLSDRPTAILCANDVIAVAAIEAARANGWRVPEDLSIVGVDNSSSVPDLTSVELGEERLGSEAVRLLFHMVEGISTEERDIAVPALRLHVRQTTAPCHLS